MGNNLLEGQRVKLPKAFWVLEKLKVTEEPAEPAPVAEELRKLEADLPLPRTEYRVSRGHSGRTQSRGRLGVPGHTGRRHTGRRHTNRAARARRPHPRLHARAQIEAIVREKILFNNRPTTLISKPEPRG